MSVSLEQLRAGRQVRGDPLDEIHKKDARRVLGRFPSHSKSLPRRPMMDLARTMHIRVRIWVAQWSVCSISVGPVKWF